MPYPIGPSVFDLDWREAAVDRHVSYVESNPEFEGLLADLRNLSDGPRLFEISKAAFVCFLEPFHNGWMPIVPIGDGNRALLSSDRGRSIEGVRVRCHYDRFENAAEITFWKGGEQLSIDEVTTMVTGLYAQTVTLTPGDG